MTIRNNGQKRDPKRILSALFLLFVGLACLYITFRKGFDFSWCLISAAIFFLAFAMFRSANEV